MELYNDLIENSWGTCGACTSMTTANSMCMAAEAMGMTLPGNATMDASGSAIYKLAYEAGKQIMYLVRNDIKARDVMSVEAIKNAIKMDMAVAGSSNLILHLPAIANEAGYDLPWWKYFDEASNQIPPAEPPGPRRPLQPEGPGSGWRYAGALAGTDAQAGRWLYDRHRAYTGGEQPHSPQV